MTLLVTLIVMKWLFSMQSYWSYWYYTIYQRGTRYKAIANVCFIFINSFHVVQKNVRGYLLPSMKLSSYSFRINQFTHTDSFSTFQSVFYRSSPVVLWTTSFQYRRAESVKYREGISAQTAFSRRRYRLAANIVVDDRSECLQPPSLSTTFNVENVAIPLVILSFCLQHSQGSFFSKKKWTSTFSWMERTFLESFTAFGQTVWECIANKQTNRQNSSLYR